MENLSLLPLLRSFLPCFLWFSVCYFFKQLKKDEFPVSVLSLPLALVRSLSLCWVCVWLVGCEQAPVPECWPWPAARLWIRGSHGRRPPVWQPNPCPAIPQCLVLSIMRRSPVPQTEELRLTFTWTQNSGERELFKCRIKGLGHLLERWPACLSSDLTVI